MSTGPAPITAPGYVFEAGFDRPRWTPAGFVCRRERYILTCERGHTGDAPLQRLIDRGEGDALMHTFTGRWTCAVCGSKFITIRLGQEDRRT